MTMSEFPGDASSPGALPQLPRATRVLLDLQGAYRKFYRGPVVLDCKTESRKVLLENLDGSFFFYDAGVEKVFGKHETKSRIHRGND